MTHQRMKSSNIYSLAHDGTTMEVRFVCPPCGGSGYAKGMPEIPAYRCSNCKGAGHTGTYSGKVPEGVFKEVRDAKSVGKEFNKRVRSNSAYKMVKV